MKEKTMPPEQREKLGRKVREVWVAWAEKQPNPKLSWLAPWDELSEPDKEVDRQIGEALFTLGAESMRARAEEAERSRGDLLAELRSTAAGLVNGVLSHPGMLLICDAISISNYLRAMAESRSTTADERSAAELRSDRAAATIKSGSFQFGTLVIVRGPKENG